MSYQASSDAETIWLPVALNPLSDEGKVVQLSGEKPAEASATAMMRQLVKLSCFPDYAVATPRRAEVKWETNDITFTSSIKKRKDLESGPLQLHVFVHDAPTLAIFQSKNEPYLSFGFSLVTESFYRSRNNHIWPRGKEQTQEAIDFMSHALHEGLRLVPDRQALCHLLLQFDDVHFGGPMFVQNYKGFAFASCRYW